MTVATDTYIQNITDSTDSTTNPEFDITFPVFNEDDLWVWTKSVATGVLTKMVRGVDYQVRINETVGTLVWIGSTPHYNTATIRVQRHMKRVQQDEYITSHKVATPASYGRGLDSVAMVNQQSITQDTLEPRHWNAEGERIANVAAGTADGDGVNKLQVDAAVGGGTSPFTVSSGDVGKWATHNGSGGYTWNTFAGTDDPRGQEYKYYTGSGWVDINTLPEISGSGDNSKLLMDIDGAPTWVAVDETVTSFTPSVSNKPNKVFTLYSSGLTITYQPSARDYHAAPQLTENMSAKRLVPVQTGYSTTYGLKNEWYDSLRITSHTTECRKSPAPNATHVYSGLTEQCDHPVYLGTVPNYTGNADVNPFFTSHLHDIPESYYVDAPGTHLGEHQHYQQFAYVFNVVSVTTSTVTFVASSLMHELTTGFTSADGKVWRHIKHPVTADISFNILWHLQR